ncbi:MAG TPA: dienelactone hydrolase family protein [Acidimicrobiales bacterium]|nr:dienelactone hydrolase family protein [Acidimicrobiales bacterium]
MPAHTERDETIEVNDGAFRAHLALPPAGSGPGLLLLQEIFGVNDFLRGKAAELAGLGYVVLAPDVFWRVEPGLDLPHDEAALEKGFAVVGRYQAEVDQATKVADLLAALGHLRSLPETSGRKVGVIGYCLGGLLAYLVAAEGDPDACVSYYGSGIANLLDLAGHIECPVLSHFGGKDPYIPADQVERIKQAFEGRDDVTVRVEPDAGHAFENLLAPQFAVPEAARRSFAATTEWLAANLA